jgi:DNA-binding Xre family transcriptional regulator|nr:MAG TPA: Cro/C1-type HTH DNA-binding domain protein [Caudoviricetes sp.]
MYKVITIDIKYIKVHYNIYKIEREEIFQMPETEKRKNLYNGNISYSRLWETMERRGVKKADLKNKDTFNLSPTLVNRLVKNQNVSVDTIMYLCDRLECQPCDILEYKK